MPERSKGEKLEDYVSRCIMARRHEHPEEPRDKSVAACYAMGREWWKANGSRKAKKRTSKG
jgi:hypothetical protein